MHSPDTVIRKRLEVCFSDGTKFEYENITFREYSMLLEIVQTINSYADKVDPDGKHTTTSFNVGKVLMNKPKGIKPLTASLQV